MFQRKKLSWFGEKSTQINGTIEAFGIPINSRYGKAKEIIEMINFCELLAVGMINDHVKSVFYDSKSSCATIELIDIKETAHPEFFDIVFECAKDTISQFEWKDNIYHKVEK